MPKIKNLSILMTRTDLANEDLSQLNFAPGFIIADRYECIELIGAGGMGAVYLVKDHILSDELVALKVELAAYRAQVEQGQGDDSSEATLPPSICRVDFKVVTVENAALKAEVRTLKEEVASAQDQATKATLTEGRGEVLAQE